MKIVTLVTAAFSAAAICVLLAAPSAEAGDLYQINFEWKGPVPTLPADIELVVYKNDDDPRGSSSEIFVANGDIPEHSCDAVACLTDTRIIDDQLCITFTATGYDNGKFASNSSFEIIVNGESSFLELHTSCSQPILLDTDLPGVPYGTFLIPSEAPGFGECFPAAPDCPEGDDLFELNGQFCISTGCTPTEVTLRVFKKEDELKGTSTATIAGGTLSDIVCDDVACLTGAFVDPGTGKLCITFDSFGSKDDGSFESDSSWEIDLGVCGTFKTPKLHTSCSDIFPLDTDYLDDPDAELVFTDGCGSCLQRQPISVEETSWGQVKGLYHEE